MPDVIAEAGAGVRVGIGARMGVAMMIRIWI